MRNLILLRDIKNYVQNLKPQGHTSLVQYRLSHSLTRSATSLPQIKKLKFKEKTFFSFEILFLCEDFLSSSCVQKNREEEETKKIYVLI